MNGELVGKHQTVFLAFLFLSSFYSYIRNSLVVSVHTGGAIFLFEKRFHLLLGFCLHFNLFMQYIHTRNSFGDLLTNTLVPLSFFFQLNPFKDLIEASGSRYQ